MLQTLKLNNIKWKKSSFYKENKFGRIDSWINDEKDFKLFQCLSSLQAKGCEQEKENIL
jgi:hypothetical protein